MRFTHIHISDQFGFDACFHFLFLSVNSFLNELSRFYRYIILNCYLNKLC